MQIEVKLFGQLVPSMERRLTLHLGRALSAEEVAMLLGVPIKEIGLIVINGVLSDASDPITPDCRLSFFPPMVGG